MYLTSGLDDRTVKDLSDLQPFVYHNRGSAEVRVRRTFDKVKEALKGRNSGDVSHPAHERPPAGVVVDDEDDGSVGHVAHRRMQIGTPHRRRQPSGPSVWRQRDVIGLWDTLFPRQVAIVGNPAPRQRGGSGTAMGARSWGARSPTVLEFSRDAEVRLLASQHDPGKRTSQSC